MKAIVYDEYGSPGVLRLTDLPVPTPGEGEVLVRVVASSINDYDWHLLTGEPWINRLGGLRTPKYDVLGMDVAGVVERAGTGATRFRVGDAVFGDLSESGLGAFAEYVVAPEKSLAPKPESLTFAQAGVVPQAGGLATVGLRGRRPLRPGDEVLVNGAGGGVGTIAIQMAKAYGAEVTAVDATHKLDVLRSVGADHVVDYTVEDVTRSGRRFDLILDIAAYHSVSRYRSCLKPGGYCGLIGGSIPRVVFTMVAGPVSSVASNRKVGVPMWRPNHPDDVATLGALLDSGAVVPVIDSTYPLAGVPDAFRHFGAQEHRGKIAIAVSPC